MKRLSAFIQLVVYTAFLSSSLSSAHIYAETVAEGTEKEACSSVYAEHRSASFLKLAGNPVSHAVSAKRYYSCDKPVLVSKKLPVSTNNPSAVPVYILHCIYRL